MVRLEENHNKNVGLRLQKKNDKEREEQKTSAGPLFVVKHEKSR
jgi:hypothetical protein